MAELLGRRWRRLGRCLVAVGLVALVGAPSPAATQSPVPLDYDVANGRFFRQTNGAPTATDPSGFAVTDDDGIPFWTEFRRLGGAAFVGYPISQRYVWDGLPVQAFQKMVLQWQPGPNRFFAVNVFDRMHDAGADDWLYEKRGIPRQSVDPEEAGLTFDQVKERRLRWLDEQPEIKALWQAAPDPLLFYGLPTSKAEDMGAFIALRCQRAAFQLWKTDGPSGIKKGQVTAANGGELAAETGVVPSGARDPSVSSGAGSGWSVGSRGSGAGGGNQGASAAGGAGGSGVSNSSQARGDVSPGGATTSTELGSLPLFGPGLPPGEIAAPVEFIQQLARITQRKQGVHPADYAGIYIERVTTIEGQVVSTENDGREVFLDFNKRYSGHFKAVILKDDWPRFQQPPEEAYRGKLVRVDGPIAAWDGPTMLVRQPEQIQAVEAPSVGETDPTQDEEQQQRDRLFRGTPFDPPGSPLAQVDRPVKARDGVVPWQDASLYVGQRVTIEGAVVTVTRSESDVTFTFGPSGFSSPTVMIYRDDWPKFTALLGQRLEGRWVQVSGVLLDIGRGLIVAREPGAIKVIDGPTVQPQWGYNPGVAPALPLSVPGFVRNQIAATTRQESAVVPAADAGSFIGKVATVEGRVTVMESDGTRAIIAFSKPYGGRMKILIYQADWPKFPQLSALGWIDKFIQVKGALLDLDGPTIVVTNPAAITEIPVPTVPITLPAPAPVTPYVPTGVPQWILNLMQQVRQVHNGVVRAADAGIFIGQITTVEGKVAAIESDPSTVSMAFSQPSANQMRVVIYRDDLARFANIGEAISRDFVQVTGPILNLDGPAIVLRDPANLRTVPVATVSDEDAAAAQLTRRATVALPTAPPAALLQAVADVTSRHEGAVGPMDAALVIGQQATVEGTVASADNDGASVRLLFGNKAGRFKAVIYRADWPKFPEAPERFYVGKMVRVTGAVVSFDGPTMLLRDPGAIQVMGG